MSLDHHIADAIAAATKQISAQIEERLRGLGSDIGQAASAERVAIVREIRLAAEAEVARKSQEAVAAAHTEHGRRLEEAVSAARAEGERRLEEGLSAARTEQTKRIDEAVAAERADLPRRIDEAVAAAKAEWTREHESGLLDARTAGAREAEAEAGRKHQAALAAAVAAAAADAAREATALHQRKTEDAVAAARAEAAQTLADALDRARADHDARLADSIEAVRAEALTAADRARVEAQVAERHAELVQVERIADDVRRLDGARSLTEVLEVLTASVANSAPRAAMFIVRGSRVAGWRFEGFPPEADPPRLDFGIDDPNLVARAIASGRQVSTSDEREGVAPVVSPFGALPAHRAGLAVPVRVGGETVAVLYADDASAQGHEAPSAWPEVTEILCRHAARCLEVLTVTRAVHVAGPAPAAAPPPRYAPQSRSGAQTSPDDDDAARRYAKLLVSEIKLYHEAVVAQGRRDRNLLERLQPEIERARRLYDDRIPADIRARMDFFGQELVRTLANGDASLLGGR